jgi:hypothetical protein
MARPEQHYRLRRTRQNGSAWIGPAASYDRLKTTPGTGHAACYR